MRNMTFEPRQIQSPDDFFTGLSKRREKGVYFYRINGTSDKVDAFLCRYYDAARKNGVVIEGKIQNPTEANLSYYQEIMGMKFQMSMGFFLTGLKKWLPRMGGYQRESVAGALYDSLDAMRQQGKTENMLKNAYIKFMCWLYYRFEPVVEKLGQDNVPKILYVGSISQYEWILISVLSGAGCDVLLVQPQGDAAYQKLDAASSKSFLYTETGLRPFAADFSVRKLTEKMQQAKENQELFGDAAGILNCTNAWTDGKGLEDILKTPAARGDRPDLYYNCYCRISGAEDKLTYTNELYQFYLSLQNEKRHVVIVNGQIPKPTPDEIAQVKRGNYTDTAQMIKELQANIQYPASPKLRGILAKVFSQVILEEVKEAGMNQNRLLNRAVYLLCWLRRYQGTLFGSWQMPDIGCFIDMGGCKDANEALFLRFLARTPADVLILCPNRNEHCCLSDSLLYEIHYETSVVCDRFPEQNAQLHIGTAAYHAERELDTLMYSDDVIFRDQQFQKANIITLQTMDREIKILWENDLKFRPNFSTVDGVVNMPVIFAKMSGVKDKNVEQYWVSIRQLITEETLVVSHAPYLTSTSSNPMKMHTTEFLKNGKLLRNRIRSHPAYPYGFLREEMQEHILDKLEAMITQRLIRGTFENGTEYTIIAVALNLPKEVTRLIQQFDFTKKNPKLIYVVTSEALPSLEDSIYVTLLSLIGFDVLFFVPTGYNIEGYFNKSLMEEHQLGDYLYDLQVPDWRTVPRTLHTSWRDKLFKRG